MCTNPLSTKAIDLCKAGPLVTEKQASGGSAAIRFILRDSKSFETNKQENMKDSSVGHLYLLSCL